MREAKGGCGRQRADSRGRLFLRYLTICFAVYIPSVFFAEQKKTSPLATRGAVLVRLLSFGEIDGFRVLWKKRTHWQYLQQKRERCDCQQTEETGISCFMEATRAQTVPCVRQAKSCEPETRNSPFLTPSYKKMLPSREAFFAAYSILSVISSCILVTPLSTKLLHELNRVTMPFLPASLRRISRFFSLTTTLRIFSFMYIIS